MFLRLFSNYEWVLAQYFTVGRLTEATLYERIKARGGGVFRRWHRGRLTEVTTLAGREDFWALSNSNL